MNLVEVKEEKLEKEIDWLRERVKNLQEKNEELTLLNNLSQHFLGNLGLQGNLDFLLEKVLSIAKASKAGIAFFNQQTSNQLYYTEKCPHRFREEVYLSRQDLPLINFTLSQGQTVIFRSKEDLPQKAKQLARELPYLGIPLKLQDKIIGVLFVQGFPFSDMVEEYLSILRLLAVPTALAIRNFLFQERLRQQEELFSHNLAATYQGIIGNLNQGILAIDKNGIITIFNNELARILGVGARAFLGKKFNQAFDWLDSKYWHILDTLEGKSYNRLEYSFQQNDRNIDVRVKARPIFDQNGRIIGGVACWQDTAQENRMYRGVAKIGQLAVVGQLAATVAHEIRNPLSAIRGLAQLSQIIPDEEEKGKKIQAILEEVDYLDNIIREWMDLSRAGKDNLELNPLDLKKLIEDLIKLLQGKMVMTKVSVTSHFPENFPLVQGNKTLLKQAFLNLLINSLQAMPEGGDIYLKGEYIKGERRVKIIIHDTGLGINQENIERVFQPFYSTKNDGTGLGLAVVHQVIAEKHQGKIWLESREGQGTTVFIHLPLE